MTNAGLPWRRIFGLHVVRNLETVARAQGLAVGFVDATTGEGHAAHAATACAHGGAGGCAEPLLRALQDDDDAGDEVAIVATHPGVRELLAPVVVRGRTAGALALGPLPDDDHAPSVLASLLQAAAWDVADVAATAPAEAPPPRGFGEIIGTSAPMRELYALLDRVARSDSTVLVQGANGTGKELVARALHEHSARRDRPFVVTNCSAFNDNLLDSELFGHKRGAFTGAMVDKPGLFELADTGTFFLDEIGDMSPALQVKVLRVLQEGTFTRVGDTDMRKVDVRIVAATHRDLRAMVARGEFREDLYYRINVINLVLPSLRQRPEDLPLLVDHFLQRQQRRTGGAPKRLTPACLAVLASHPWPGNVRELENEIERLVVLAGDEAVIGEELVSARIRDRGAAAAAAPDPEPTSLPEAVEALERRMIGDALRRLSGNKTRAALELRVSRRNLIRLAQKYGL